MLKLLMNLQILKCAGSPECLHPVELARDSESFRQRQMPTQKLPGLES